MATAPEYCPVSIGASIVSERWNLLIIRELFTGARGFNDIHRGLPGLSRTLLSRRLRTLQQAGLITAAPANASGSHGYRLTSMGADLRTVLSELGAWSVRWCFPRPEDDQLDPHLLLWRMRRGLVEENLPDRRVTVELTFAHPDGSPPTQGWLILDGEDSSACIRHPMFEVDLYARATSRVWHELWYGHRAWRDVIEHGELRLSGRTELVERFPGWFQLSVFAGQVTDRRRTAT